MKLFTATAIVVLVLCTFITMFGAISCVKTTPPPEVPFSEVLSQPAEYLQKEIVFTDGTVLYKGEQGDANVLIVGANPLPLISGGETIPTDQIIGLTVPQRYYDEILLGHIITAHGKVLQKTVDSTAFYYVHVWSTTIVGSSDIPTTDFERIVSQLEEQRNSNAEGPDIFDAFFNPFSTEGMMKDLLFDDF